MKNSPPHMLYVPYVSCRHNQRTHRRLISSATVTCHSASHR